MSHLLKIIFITIFFLKAPPTWGFSTSRFQEYQNQAKSKNLAISKGWLRLGHYEKTFLGSWKSTLRGSFFLAEKGYENPEAELLETLRRFFQEGPQEDHAQCKFLGRREWLIKNLAIHPDDLLECKEKIAWKKNLDAIGVSLIFASADTSSASSIYGHTFLKILRRGHQGDKDLLNYGVNYAAMATDAEGFFYAVKGLFGFYKGGYTMLPYHEKLKEYVNLDGRDIWEYRLNLNQKQVDQLLNHLLELNDSWSPYYFAWDNCSFQLLSLLEVANEDIDLVDKFKNFVIPLDTIKVVIRTPGLVLEKKIRPSLKREFTENYRRMGSAQKNIFNKTIENNSLPDVSSLSKEDQIGIYDTAMTFYTLKSYQEGLSYDDEKYRVLSARSRLGQVPPAQLSKSFPPDETHDSSGIYIGGGKQNELNFASFKFRTAFHDMVSKDAGLFEFSENEALTLDMRYFPEQSRLDLQKFTVFSILTSRPIYELEKPLSWKIQVYTEPKLRPHLQTGFGYSIDIPQLPKTRFIGLVSAQLDPTRIGLGPDLFIIHRWKDWFALMANYRGSWNNENYQSIWNGQIGIPINQQWELRLEFAQSAKFENEWQARVLKQFIM